MKRLHIQYRIRLSGENGLSKIYSEFNNNLDICIQKLSHHSDKNEPRMTEQEWRIFFETIEEWFCFMSKLNSVIGSCVKEIKYEPSEDSKSIEMFYIGFNSVYRRKRKQKSWLY
jgi:hypothetical protein